MPADADSYLHRVGRAGRFGTKGLAISFVNSEQDKDVLKAIEKRFEVALRWVLWTVVRLTCANELGSVIPPEGIDPNTYMAS